MIHPTPRCHGPRMRATQMSAGLSARVDTRLLGGPDKPGHDSFVLKVMWNA
jgi:hypothetical protein